MHNAKSPKDTKAEAETDIDAFPFFSSIVLIFGIIGTENTVPSTNISITYGENEPITSAPPPTDKEPENILEIKFTAS